MVLQSISNSNRRRIQRIEDEYEDEREDDDRVGSRRLRAVTLPHPPDMPFSASGG